MNGTIGVIEQRKLIEITRELGRALTNEEYNSIILVYNKVLDRVMKEVK